MPAVGPGGRGSVTPATDVRPEWHATNGNARGDMWEPPGSTFPSDGLVKRLTGAVLLTISVVPTVIALAGVGLIFEWLSHPGGIGMEWLVVPIIVGLLAVLCFKWGRDSRAPGAPKAEGLVRRPLKPIAPTPREGSCG